MYIKFCMVFRGMLVSFGTWTIHSYCIQNVCNGNICHVRQSTSLQPLRDESRLPSTATADWQVSPLRSQGFLAHDLLRAEVGESSAHRFLMEPNRRSIPITASAEVLSLAAPLVPTHLFDRAETFISPRRRSSTAWISTPQII